MKTALSQQRIDGDVNNVMNNFDNDDENYNDDYTDNNDNCSYDKEGYDNDDINCDDNGIQVEGNDCIRSLAMT